MFVCVETYTLLSCACPHEVALRLLHTFSLVLCPLLFRHFCLSTFIHILLAADVFLFKSKGLNRYWNLPHSSFKQFPLLWTVGRLIREVNNENTQALPCVSLGGPLLPEEIISRQVNDIHPSSPCHKLQIVKCPGPRSRSQKAIAMVIKKKCH